MNRVVLALVAALLIGGGGFAVGQSVADPETRIIRRPVPGPTETVVKTKKVRVENPLDFALVPPRTPLRIPATKRFGKRAFMVPRGAKIEQFERVAAGSGIPPQRVVTWRKGKSHLPEALGLLVWQLEESGAKDFWRVVFGIHEAELGCHRILSDSSPRFQRRNLEFHCLEHEGALVGPPTRERIEKLRCGQVGPSIGFSLHDLTADGHQDVLVREGGCGSGGATLWRVLTSTPTGTRQILRRFVADTRIAARDGTLRIQASVRGTRAERCGIHGCSDRHRLRVLRWTGGGWQLIESTIVSTASPYPLLLGSGRAKIYGPHPEQPWGRCVFEARSLRASEIPATAEIVLQALPYVYSNVRARSIDIDNAQATAQRGKGRLPGRKCDGDPDGTARVSVTLPEEPFRRLSRPVFFVSPVWDGWVVWNLNLSSRQG